MDNRLVASLREERTLEAFQKDFPVWWINLNDPAALLEHHPSYLWSQVVCFLGTAICLLHAFSRGGRWPYIYLAGLGSGLTTEITALFGVGDSFWHASSLVDLFGRRLPLHVVLIYALLYYQAFWAVSKLQLRCRWSEHIATGLLVLLLNVPLEIVGIKFAHWSWHDTDPQFDERHLFVPWMVHCLHATFGFAFSFFLHNTRRWIDREQLDRWQRGSMLAELTSVMAAACLTAGAAGLLTMSLHRVFGDMLHLPVADTTIVLLLATGTVFWKFDRKSARTLPERTTFMDKLLYGHLLLYLTSWLGTVLFLQPEDVVSSGLHQPVGDCNARTTLNLGLRVIERGKFLCAKKYDESYFDFHCQSNIIPKDGAYWYTICGTPFEDRTIYIFILTTITLLTGLIFWTLHFDYDRRFAVYDLVKKPQPKRADAKKNK